MTVYSSRFNIKEVPIVYSVHSRKVRITKMRKIVLMYHDVYSDSETESGFQFPTSFPYKISAEKFESHVKLAHTYCKQNNLSLDSVEFTFDDGGVSFYTVIAPILEKYGFKGVFFILMTIIY